MKEREVKRGSHNLLMLVMLLKSGLFTFSFCPRSSQVLTNPAWLFITLGITGSFLVLVGLVTFTPKYLESQFGLNPSSAGLVAGGVGESVGRSPLLLAPLTWTHLLAPMV